MWKMLTEYLLSILLGVNIALWTVSISCGLAAAMCAIALDSYEIPDEKAAALRKSRFRYFVLGVLAIVLNALVPTSGELVDAHNDRCSMAGEICGK
jgi:hypothetical protein